MTEFSIDVQRLSGVTVIRCAGALVDGAATTLLHRAVAAALPVDVDVVLNLADLEYVDSFGLGVLTRLLATIQQAGGRLMLCAVPAHVARVLAVTHLNDVLEMHTTEQDALAALARAPQRSREDAVVNTDVFCVESSPELLAFVQQVLRADGLHVATAGNVADAFALFRAKAPRVVLIGASLREAFDARARRYPGTPVIELPAELRTEDPATAAEWLLQQVRAILPSAS